MFPFKLCTTRAWSVILHFYNYPNGITLLIVSQIMESMFPDDVLNKAKYKINIIFSLPSLPFPLPHSGWDSKYGQIRKLLFILKFHSYLRITLKFYFLHNYHNQQWCFYIWSQSTMMFLHLNAYTITCTTENYSRLSGASPGSSLRAEYAQGYALDFFWTLCLADHVILQIHWSM